MGWQWHQLNHVHAICTLLQKITMLAPHQSDFYGPDALPYTQPTASKHCASRYQKYKSLWILLKHRWWGDSGISLITWKSFAHCFRQPCHHVITSFFTGRVFLLPSNQQCQTTDDILCTLTHIAYLAHYWHYYHWSLFWFSSVVGWPSVLWCCWLGVRKGIWPVKIWLMRCWHGYLLERSANCLRMVQLMPLPPRHVCFSKIQISISWYWLTWVVLDRGS